MITPTDVRDGLDILCEIFQRPVTDRLALVWHVSVGHEFNDREEWLARIAQIIRTSTRFPTPGEVICTTDEAAAVKAGHEQFAAERFNKLMTYPRRCLDYDPRTGTVMVRALVEDEYGFAIASAFIRCGGDATFSNDEEPWQRKEFIESYVRDMTAGPTETRREALKAVERRALKAAKQKRLES